MSKRSDKMLAWAVKHCLRWPESVFDAPNESVADIGAKWMLLPEVSSMPVLQDCSNTDCCVTSCDWFYASRSPRIKQLASAI